MFFAFGIEFVTHLDGSLFKLLHGPLSFFHSRAKRHGDGGGHVIALDRWENVNRHARRRRAPIVIMNRATAMAIVR